MTSTRVVELGDWRELKITVVSYDLERLAAVKVVARAGPREETAERRTCLRCVLTTDMEGDPRRSMRPVEDQHGVEGERLTSREVGGQIIRRRSLLIYGGGDESIAGHAVTEIVGEDEVGRRVEQACDSHLDERRIHSAKDRGDGHDSLRRCSQVVSDARPQVAGWFDERRTEESSQGRQRLTHILGLVTQVRRRSRKGCAIAGCHELLSEVGPEVRKRMTLPDHVR